MDSEDTDARDQNLHLIGKTSSKVSSYTPPKFEFDDSLQGHLRFDSLVENEVFLGITSQEDNQWIEEYSCGTNAVESSSKNVWSEATSSESVAMLLKSVGQEEKVLEETNKPVSLTNVMDSNNQDNFVGSKVVIGDKCESSVGEETIDKIGDDVNQEASRIANQSSINKSQEDPSVSKEESVEECRDKPQELVNNPSIVENVTDHIIKNKEIFVENPTVDSNVESLAVEDANTESKIPDSHAQSHSVKETEIDEEREFNNVGKSLITADCSAEMSTEDISNKDELPESNAPKVHTGDSNDETQSLESDACRDVDVVGALDSQKNVIIDSVAAVESSKISSPVSQDGAHLSSGTAVTAEDQPRSPILGVRLQHDVIEEKEQTPEVDNAVDSSLDDSLPVVEKNTVSDGAEKDAHELAGPPVGNLNLDPSEQIAEENTDDSPANGCTNAEEEVVPNPQESMSGEDGAKSLNLAVNVSDVQQASVAVAGPSELDTDNLVHHGGGSPSLDKPQSFSFSDTKSTELFQVAKDKLEIVPLPKLSNDGNTLQSVSSSSVRKEETSFTFENTEVSSINPSGSQLDPIKLHEDSLVSPQTPTEEGPKEKSERKPRKKSVGIETIKKGGNLEEVTLTKRSRKVEKSPPLVTLPPTTGHVTPVKKLKPNESVECSNTPVYTSNLPDLNSSTSLFQHMFTDSQQVQLRAQILVYGSLLSGMLPEEPHMITAFGHSDGGRRIWEAAWHACLERVRAQPSNPHSSTPDQGTKTGFTQTKILSGVPSPVLSPMIPISSPLWNITTPCDGLQSNNTMPRNTLFDYRQTLSPLHLYQTSQVQSFGGHTPPWLSHGPSPGQWAASPISRFSALPITESVKLTTVKESGATSIPVNPSARSSVSTGQPLSDSKSRKRKKVAATDGSSSIPRFSALPITESVKLTTVKESGASSIPVNPSARPSVSTGQPLSDSKSRKRKKVMSTDGYNLISFPAQNQTNSAMVPTSAVLSTPVSISSKDNSDDLSKIVTREEIVSKIGESKLQAEDAAVHAAAAVSHCQEVWSQLEKQKNSGLVSDDEVKLAFSAVSVAAASSVAKVAAAAAKIASNVSEQARLMADEVFLSSGTKSNDQSSSMISHDKATSIISAARDVVRRRIEAASAASKHAENLDAILKAAELAAEAVSQAGKIVAMGNPLSLKVLVESGPEGYWKNPDPSNQNVKTNQTALNNKDDSGDLAKNKMMIIDGISGSVTSNENVNPESEFGSVRTSDVDQNMPQSTSGAPKDNIIKEASLVEVCKDSNKMKGAWFAANVLTLKDDEAFVCYAEIQSDEGSGKLKEWVPLEVEGTETPKIRIAHPMTTLGFEGAKKRGRTALTDCAWCSGDRVDVWVNNCWCEAVVMATNKIDVTSLTVQFPAQGETSIVRSWHVRPTLIWKNNKWIEWSSLKGSRSSEGDTPHQKRQKFDTPVVEGKEKNKLSVSVNLVESVRNQESRIPTFDIGKSSRNDNKLDTRKTMKTKERPRVVFGVPKPGKKQKFMDVSAQYVADVSNKNDAKEKQSVRSRKPPVPSLRTLALKDKPKPSKPTSHDSVSVDENLSGHPNQFVFGSENAKETSTSKGISQRLNKGKTAQKSTKFEVKEKSTKFEVKEKSTSEADIRRSNRRIQPTSRLLEGLQSSLTLSKTPTASHASQKSRNKLTPKGSGTPS